MYPRGLFIVKELWKKMFEFRKSDYILIIYLKKLHIFGWENNSWILTENPIFWSIQIIIIQVIATFKFQFLRLQGRIIWFKNALKALFCDFRSLIISFKLFFSYPASALLI